MEQTDIIKLIKAGVVPGTWADFGSGTGTFTLALRKLAGPDIKIYSVDKNSRSLKKQKEQFDTLFSNTNIEYVEKDFTENLSLPQLDGLLMANSLHFVKYKESFIDSIKDLLKPNGRIIIVEYDTDSANPYIPHPLSYGKLKGLLEEKGFSVQKIGQAPSTYQRSMYGALATG